MRSKKGIKMISNRNKGVKLNLFADGFYRGLKINATAFSSKQQCLKVSENVGREKIAESRYCTPEFMVFLRLLSIASINVSKLVDFRYLQDQGIHHTCIFRTPLKIIVMNRAS